MLLIIIILLLFVKLSPGEENNAVGDVRGRDRLLFLPEVALLLDGASYLDNDLKYTAVTRRALTIDIIRYNNIVFATGINEVLTYREMGDVKYDPWLIHYDMDYFSIRWEFGRTSLIYFMDHLCTNIINQERVGLRELRWYGTGIRLETEGMRPGHMDISAGNGGTFIFINNFNYMLAAVYPLSNGAKKRFRYDLLLKGALRYDIARIYNLTPYLEGSFWGIIDEDYSRIRYDRTAEAGIRIGYYDIDMMPYVSYTHKNDTEIYNGPAMEYYLIGFRMESVIFDFYKSDSGAGDIHTFLPEIHFLGQYAKYLANDNRNINHKFNVDIDIFRFDKFSVFTANSLRHDSTGKGGLFPRYMDVYGEAGARYMVDVVDLLIEPNYKYERFDDGNKFRGYRQRFETAGLRLGNRKMRMGYINDAISFNNTDFQWLFKFGWQISANRTICGVFYPYDWDLSAKIQWDIIRKYLFIPYAAAQARCLIGRSTAWAYTADTGIRLYDFPQTVIFHEYVCRTDSDPENGISNRQSMFGLRVEL
ncbi:MAG: hypothetical protein MUC95_02515 [Spirochaetes bacterium]|nr:hypothetical protein [Spirochaetota bacterium]